MKKYPKIFGLDREETEGLFDGEIVLQEKVDGGGFRFMFKSGEIYFGSRNQELEESNENTRNWERIIKYLQETLTGKIKDEGYVYFGEAVLRHTLNYDFDKMPPFLGFDIWDIKKEVFLPFDEVVEHFKYLDIEMVPLIKRGVWNKDITKEDLEIPRSKYVDNWAEGIVIKNYDKQIFGKIVSDKFKEENRLAFGGSKKWAEDDAEYFTLMFCTNPRIDKIIFKMIDNGQKLEMKMMETLPKEVYEDIWEENWKEISVSNKTIDIKRFRKLVTNRCLAVLRQMITNKGLER